ncbi:hypothetical protein [Rhodobacter maris]|uniref:Uncharacterized protein n=1 Tax=Rhodobacter maris TaxID=446682 RepID=A0A285RM92_9RHOB|nr:hypothetical protein [Rhodobacter maris]SOB95231.1 hypothetical protein SAMN05877831_101857 [Rhodobacter maris]
MATHFTTTPRGVMKPVAQPSSIVRKFPKFLIALAAYVEAERDAESDWATDPACLNWLRDAERARSTVLDQIGDITKEELDGLGDQSLKATAMLTRIMIESSSSSEFFKAFALLDTHPARFTCPEYAPARVKQMVRTARQRLADLTTLSAFVDPCEADPEADVVATS